MVRRKEKRSSRIGRVLSNHRIPLAFRISWPVGWTDDRAAAATSLPPPSLSDKRRVMIVRRCRCRRHRCRLLSLIYRSDCCMMSLHRIPCPSVRPSVPPRPWGGSGQTRGGTHRSGRGASKRLPALSHNENGAHMISGAISRAGFDAEPRGCVDSLPAHFCWLKFLAVWVDVIREP